MKLKLPKLSDIPYLNRLDRTVLLALLIAAGATVTVIIWFLSGSSSIKVSNRSDDDTTRSRITDEACEDPERRPIAIMLASDPEARPLSGIAQAELVFELPVAPGGITRMMAVFQCSEPEEIGSIRSARGDFLGLAASIDALFAHWGGERDALERLDGGELDNIDALVYEGTVFFRKDGVPPPHNGFTTLEDIWKQAKKLDYDEQWSASFWPHRTSKPHRSLGSAVGGMTITYPNGNRVRWTYDGSSNRWIRSRDGDPEEDALDGMVAQAGAVIILETQSRFLREQYIDVDLEGSGTGIVLQDGMRRTIEWSRTDERSALQLRYDSGEPVALAPGPVWIMAITEGTDVQ